MLVIRNMGDNDPPPLLARNEGPWASGYVLPDPSTLATAVKKALTKKKAVAGSPSSAAAADPTSALTTIRASLASIPLVVWICIVLGAAGAVWYVTSGQGRRRGRARPFGRTRRRRR